MKTVRCHDCGSDYPFHGSNHCHGGKYGGCCQTFTSQAAFDAHRVGPFQPVERRRCLTTLEMCDLGWRRTERGWTRTPGTLAPGHSNGVSRANTLTPVPEDPRDSQAF